VEKAAAPAPFIAIFPAREIRQEYALQNDETGPTKAAVDVR
jgi:hypothetical protein